jgi:peptidoglycan biosynthesis protein MviN/MurJ (putative lipid II flippase)
MFPNVILIYSSSNFSNIVHVFDSKFLSSTMLGFKHFIYHLPRELLSMTTSPPIKADLSRSQVEDLGNNHSVSKTRYASISFVDGV